MIYLILYLSVGVLATLVALFNNKEESKKVLNSEKVKGRKGGKEVFCIVMIFMYFMYIFVWLPSLIYLLTKRKDK